ncbi:MAG: sugar ABC transporter substrate-binding protein [Blastocatellia bacterium]|nr:sugar ABC transporter substrate-binding protein [Blastocatellia bacterium]MDW8257370.1 sugar ABC transporter substrate-binding protein [Acidobacteriota bacterium]
MSGKSFRALAHGAMLVAAALLLNGCGHEKRTAKWKIAVVTKALDSEWWMSVKQGCEAAAREHPDVEVVVLAPEREINVDQQVAILEDQILKKVSALVVAPAGPSEVIPVLEKAKAAGIPVLLMDTEAPWPDRVSFVGLDNRLGGRLVGEYFVRALGGSGKVAVIRGILGISTHEERIAGFREALAQTPGIHLVTIQPANSERALGMSVMENILTAHPDVKAVFATNDQMALGAMEALAARKLTGRILLVGFDATQEALRAVKAGQLQGTVAGHGFEMGKRAVELAIRTLRGEPVEKHVEIRPTLVTRENVDQFLR